MAQPRNFIRAALVVAVIVLAALPGPARTTQPPADCLAPSSPICITTGAGGVTDSASASSSNSSVPRPGHSGLGLRGIVLLVAAALGSVWLLGARVRRWMIGI
jgi:hypothetical protein